MTQLRTHGLNGMALLVAIGACLAIALNDAPAPTSAAAPGADTREVRDADNVAIPIRRYQRIASMSPIADAILLETIPAQRLVGVSGTMRDALGAHRFESLRSIDDASVEQVLALDPDLVIVTGMSAAGQVTQLRDAGVQVFRMGEMRGITNFVQDARDIARAVGAGDAGQHLGEQLVRRLQMVAADIPESERPRGLYLGVIGRGLYGGASRTSYHDVLVAAGLRDAVAHIDSWPELTPEQVIELDPDVVVVHAGTGRALCERDGLRTLRACRHEAGAQVVELPSALLNDPGLGMLPCAELLRLAVHGAPASAPREAAVADAPAPLPPEEPSPE